MINGVMLNRIKRFFVSLFTTKKRKGVRETKIYFCDHVEDNYGFLVDGDGKLLDVSILSDDDRRFAHDFAHGVWLTRR